MSSEIAPGKGVLTQYIQMKHDEILRKNKERYEEIMRRQIQNQLNFDTVLDRVKKTMDDYNKQLTNTVAVYLSLDLGELFQVGSEEGLWLVGKDGYVVNFANTRDYIRQSHIKSYDGKKQFRKSLKHSSRIARFWKNGNEIVCVSGLIRRSLLVKELVAGMRNLEILK